MITLLSPSKTLDFETPKRTQIFTQPEFLDKAKQLVGDLSKLSPKEIQSLMGVSPSIAALNVDRYRQWNLPFTIDNAKQALLAFTGDVFTGLDAATFTSKDDSFAQEHLRILSGLYGVLRPLDLIQPYRLEMGTKFPEGSSLYKFWGDAITKELNGAIAKSASKCVINLASQEYYKSVKEELLSVPVITPVFKEKKNGTYKVIAIFAKKARGMMARFIIKNRITSPDLIKDFSEGGYFFDPKSSTDSEYTFLNDRDS